MASRFNAKEACEAVEWPVIVMLACLIPVGEGLKDTGATAPIANGLAHAAAQIPGRAAVGLVLLAAMLPEQHAGDGPGRLPLR